MLAQADVYQLNSATDRGGAGKCAVSRYTIRRGYIDAKGTLSQKVRLLDVSN